MDALIDMLPMLPGIFCTAFLFWAVPKWNKRVAAENEARRAAEALEFELYVQRRIAGLIP